MKIRILASLLVVIVLMLVAQPVYAQKPGFGISVLYAAGGWGVSGRYRFPNFHAIDLQYVSASSSGSGPGYTYSGSESDIYPSFLFALTREGKMIPYAGIGLCLLSANATYNFDGTVLSATISGTGYRVIGGVEYFFAENNSFEFYAGIVSASGLFTANGYSATYSLSAFTYGLGFRYYF